MPLKIVKSGKGYKVRKTEKEPNGTYKYISKKPVSLARAKRQLRAKIGMIVKQREFTSIIKRKDIKGLRKHPTAKLLRKYLEKQLKK